MNMNAKVLAGALFGVLALHASSANAIDIKAHHGSECKVYGTTPWTDLGFGWQGIFNTTDVAKVIVCPLVKDSETNWDGTALEPLNAAYVDIHYRAGATPTSITCTVYTSRTSTLTSSATMTQPIPANSQTNYDLTGLVSNGSPNDVGSIMICTLGGKAILQHYRLVEPALTDG